MSLNEETTEDIIYGYYNDIHYEIHLITSNDNNPWVKISFLQNNKVIDTHTIKDKILQMGNKNWKIKIAHRSAKNNIDKMGEEE